MFSQYAELYRGDAVVVGCDTSMGAGDWCVAQFLVRPKTSIDLPSVPLVYRSKNAAPAMTDALVLQLERIFDTTGVKPIVAYERNNGGAFEMERLASLNHLHKFEVFLMPDPTRTNSPEPTRLGWDTNTVSRPAMLAAIKDLIDSKRILLWDKPTIAELSSFVNIRTSTAIKAQAERSAHDDCVMSLAIAWQVHELSPMPVAREKLGALMRHNQRALAGQ